MTDTMPRKLPLYVVRDTSRHGRVRFYFRRGKGKRTRLPDQYPSEEFNRAYKAALLGEELPKAIRSASPTDRLEWLIDRYRESSKWAAFSIATRKQRGLIFAEVLRRGNPRYTDITKGHIQRAMDERAATPAQANNFRKAMSGLFDWAVTADYMTQNPCVGVSRVTYRSKGFPPWTVEDARVFCERWPVGTKPRLAFELFLASGLRRGDIHIAGRQHLRGSIFSMTTRKTGSEITVQFSQSLLDIIAATATGDLHFIVKENGEPFASKESFGNWFSDRCRDAGLAKSAHGIRKLAATVAADSGATAHELMAHFGWAKVEQAEVYTKGADRKRLGIQSSVRVANHFKNAMPLTSNPGAVLSPKNIKKTNAQD